MTYRKLGPSWNLRLVRQGLTTPSSWRGLAGIGGAEFRRRCEGVFSAKRVKTAFRELAGRRG
jgi:hypothetical protein